MTVRSFHERGSWATFMSVNFCFVKNRTKKVSYLICLINPTIIIFSLILAKY